jgi:NAD(P)-dependent dehydrogenase (short-subunit alcohol dehydrogenase family)
MNSPETSRKSHPGISNDTTAQMIYIRDNYQGSEKLKDKAALITGGDSGIGKAIALHFAREGADVAILYHPTEDKDAKATQRLIKKEGRKGLLICGDLMDPYLPQQAVQAVTERFGKLDILVNNAAVQHPKENFADILPQDWEETFTVNVYAGFRMTREALPYLQEGASIINTVSVVAYQGHGGLIDYASSKGAMISFTRSLAQNLAAKKIRVNAVAPGPIWTPLVASTFPDQNPGDFGKNVPLQRGGQPWEVAACYVFLASDDSSYITGQVLHPNGGEMINT